MAFLERFYPGDYVDSTYDIDYEVLYSQGFRGIIFDIDNTLVEHGMPATGRAVELFERLRRTGFDTCVISNNKEPRVAQFANEVGTKYIYDAKKPSTNHIFQTQQDICYLSIHHRLKLNVLLLQKKLSYSCKVRSLKQFLLCFC